MKTQYINPNYSHLFNNLSPKIKKISNIYRVSSPVVIKTFGDNNYVYERKYKSNLNNIDQNDVYDYIENELKKSKVNRAHTTCTEPSTQENMSIFSSQVQKNNKKCYKNYTNINNEGDYYIYPCNLNNDKYFIMEKNDKKIKTYIGDEKNYRQKILKKEGISEIFIPKEKYNKSPNITNIKNSNYQNHIQNSTELKSQSFSASFIPENKSRINKSNNENNIFEIKYIKSKKVLPTKEIDLNISSNNNSFNSNKRESSFSKSKNQLADFNIDKLIEIGDNLAKRRLTKIKRIEINNLDKDNFNKSLDLKDNSLIKNMMVLEEKRKQSKKKNINVVNNIKKNIIISENKGKNKTPDKIINKDHNINKINIINEKYDQNNRIKIIKMDKKNLNDLKIVEPPNAMKIKLKHKIMGKQYNINLNNNSGDKGKRIKYYNNIININNLNKNNNDTKIKINHNHNISPNRENLILKLFDKKKVNSPQKITQNKYINKSNKINLKEKYKNMNLNIINHSYLESINIKKQNQISKAKRSFKDIFVPSE